MVEAIKAELDHYKKADPLNLKALEFRKDINKARSEGNERLADVMEDLAVDKAEELEKTFGLVRAKTWFQLATTEGKTLDELVDIWLADSDYIEQTKKQHKKAYEDFKAFMGGDNVPSAVTDEAAITYVEDVIKKSKKAPATQRRNVNSLLAFWEWMGLRKHVPRGFNPWRGFKISNQRTSKKTEDKRPYTDEELVKLLSSDVDYPGLSDVILFGLYTGARLEEICSLKIGDIRKNGDGIWFVQIKKSKTKAGVRTIAISHRIPCSILEYRWSDDMNTEDQLFPEFKPGGYDEKLSWSVSKAFGRFRDKVGLSRATDFHSLRRSFITMMENLSMDQVKIARYVGHDLPTIAFTVYSGGSSEQTNIEVARGIIYSADVENATTAFLHRAKEQKIKRKSYTRD